MTYEYENKVDTESVEMAAEVLEGSLLFCKLGWVWQIAVERFSSMTTARLTLLCMVRAAGCGGGKTMKLSDVLLDAEAILKRLQKRRKVTP
jgi:hypothetical protein